MKQLIGIKLSLQNKYLLEGCSYITEIPRKFHKGLYSIYTILSPKITSIDKNSSISSNKYPWNIITRHAINNKQSLLWLDSVQNNPDFIHFKNIHHDIKQIFKTTSEFKLADYIARLWVVFPHETYSVCPLCEHHSYDLADI